MQLFTTTIKNLRQISNPQEKIKNLERGVPISFVSKEQIITLINRAREAYELATSIARMSNQIGNASQKSSISPSDDSKIIPLFGKKNIAVRKSKS